MGHRYPVDGCGRMDNNAHLPAIDRLENVDLIAVCDVDERRARAASDK